MNDFVKTLVGDRRNVSAVAGLVVVAAALSLTGHEAWVAFVIPPLTLAGVWWLARH